MDSTANNSRDRQQDLTRIDSLDSYVSSEFDVADDSLQEFHDHGQRAIPDEVLEWLCDSLGDHEGSSGTASELVHLVELAIGLAISGGTTWRRTTADNARLERAAIRLLVGLQERQDP